MNSYHASPDIFHIHVDATSIEDGMYEKLITNYGFDATDFCGHPEGYSHFEPTRHLTLKLRDKEQYHQRWVQVKNFLKQSSTFKGYLEGEYIPADEPLSYAPYVKKAVPFFITRRKLDSGQGEFFRQSEIHVTMHKERSSKKLVTALMKSGLYGAYIPKRDADYVVLTAQGKKREINGLYHVVKQFLIESGGAYDCSLKEERAIDFELFGVKSKDLPDVIDTLSYTAAM
ncbi:MAG: hypothetical protein COB04_18620 [Gammaproteobacteria bacterium]|nr:MAG: hypothetical protein COB04_18620 [Gammaproteobacteria bacterium]